MVKITIFQPPFSKHQTVANQRFPANDFPKYTGLSPPPRMPVANEGLGWDPPLKYDDPGGDWHPGQGDNPTYICLY